MHIFLMFVQLLCITQVDSRNIQSCRIVGIYNHAAMHMQTNTENTFKGGLQRLLRIGSAHNNGGHLDLKITQISHVSNFCEHKLYHIFI